MIYVLILLAAAEPWEFAGFMWHYVALSCCMLHSRGWKFLQVPYESTLGMLTIRAPLSLTLQCTINYRTDTLMESFNVLGRFETT